MSIGYCRVVVLALAATSLLAGCGSRRVTDPPRTAAEQLLISAAVDRAVGQLDFSPLRDTRVYILDSLVDRIDKSFLIATVRMHAWYSGCIVVDDPAEADAILELRSGAVGVEHSEYLLGIPEVTIPSPFGTVPIPESAIFKTVKQIGASRVSFVAYRADDRRFLYTSGPFYGFADQRTWWIFGAGPVVNDDIQPEGAAGSNPMSAIPWPTPSGSEPAPRQPTVAGGEAAPAPDSAEAAEAAEPDAEADAPSEAEPPAASVDQPAAEVAAGPNAPAEDDTRAP